MEKILVSACLLGFEVRYDGSSNRIAHDIWEKWKREGRLVSLCPEVSSGLPVPRPPAEIVGGGGVAVLEQRARVREASGGDVTEHFVRGAEQALEAARTHRLRIAVLKEGSPSCGATSIHDGTFSGHRRRGEGVVAALLRRNGVRVFGEAQLEEAAAYLRFLESSRAITR